MEEAVLTKRKESQAEPKFCGKLRAEPPSLRKKKIPTSTHSPVLLADHFWTRYFGLDEEYSFWTLGPAVLDLHSVQSIVLNCGRAIPQAKE